MFRLDKSKGVLIPTPIEADYILKPDGFLKELPANEHVTMAIAKRIGLDVPPFSILQVDPEDSKKLIFAIKRFDRTHRKTPLLKEDMCQINQIKSSNKYSGSYEGIAKSIQKFSSAPKIDLHKFYQRLLFCYFIANADMHLKNWSLLENEKGSEGRFILSPCYDLLNTRLVIPKESTDIGLPLNGKQRHLQKSYFKTFGQERLKLSLNSIENTFSQINHWWEVTEDFVNASLLSKTFKEKYLEIVYKRYQILK